MAKVIFLKYKIKEFEGFKNLVGPEGPVTLCISRELIVGPEGKTEMEPNKERRCSQYFRRWKKMRFVT